MLVIQSILLSIGIDAFGYLKSVVEWYLFNDKISDSEGDKIIEINSQKTCACTLDEYGLRFWPPLYMQRYMAIQEIIEHPIWNASIKKVVDFGCSELGLFRFIKPVAGLNNIVFVDVDYNTLDLNQTKILPTNYDFLSMHERKEPLTVDIYNGSIADLDDRMLGIDAVICIELIEHLYLDVLEAVPYTVFEFIKPKLAMFTTPNVEFNILFPNFTTQFRHDDHKFEWTRKQFQKWANSITTRYPEYAVQIEGIGAGPLGTENLGCCTQMAIFYRKDMKTSPVTPLGSQPYKLLRRVTYPFEMKDENTIKKRNLCDMLKQFVLQASFKKEYTVCGNMEIPLNKIMPYVADYCSSIDELKDIADILYHTKENDEGQWLLLKPNSNYSSDEYRSDSDLSTNISGQEDTVHNHSIDEDWDALEGMSFGNSNHCFSTPMNKNQEDIYLKNVNSSNTVFSNSDLYETAIAYSQRVFNEDMEISSSCNGSIIVNDCEVYKEFVLGRNNSAIDENINDTGDTLTNIKNSNEFSNDSGKVNENLIDDNTVIQNGSNISLVSNHTSGTINEIQSNNCNSFTNSVTNEDKEIDTELSVCLNRTLLDESGYTENLLFTSDK